MDKISPSPSVQQNKLAYGCLFPDKTGDGKCNGAGCGECPMRAENATVQCSCKGAGVSERLQMLKKCERYGKAIEREKEMCYNLTILKNKETMYYG